MENIAFLHWSVTHRNNNVHEPKVCMPTFFTKSKYGVFCFPAPFPPEHYSRNCLCLNCSLFTLLTYDETLADNTPNGNDGVFKVFLNKAIH